jgi:diguanylate cyclase (GGDEF)-like protein/PAS domain S-box-containing protein
LEFITLKSIVSSFKISFYATQTLSQALTSMAEHKISSVIIVDEQEMPIGIFTEHDALRVVSENIDINTTLNNLMSKNPFCIEESVHLHDAYIIMEEKEYRHLVVVDEAKRFVGIVTEGDFLRHMGFEELSKVKVVADVISKMPLLVPFQTSITETASLMKDSKSDYAVLVDAREPVGVVTERDIAHFCVNMQESQDNSALSLAHKNFKIVKKDLSLYDATALMPQHSVHQLIIVDENQEFIGSLNRHDILHAVHGSYFDFLVQLIDTKNEKIQGLEEIRKELSYEKNLIQSNKLKYQKLFEAIPDGAVLIDTQTLKAVEFNAAAHNQLGYTAEEFAELTIADYEKSMIYAEIIQTMRITLQNGFGSFETLHCRKDGKILDMFINVIAVKISGIDYLMGIYRDISEQKAKEKELQKKDENLNIAQALAHVGSWNFDIQKNILQWSDETYRIFGLELGSMMTYDILLEYIYPEDVEKITQAWNEAMLTKKYDIEHRINVNGEIKWVHEFAKFELDDAGELVYALGTVQEITQRKLYEQRLETLANYDSLTGLANRSLLVSHLHKSIQHAKRVKHQIALLMFDLDRFKDINDSYGHSAGDELLQLVAQRFSARLREGDIISRLGGDEFALVLQNIAHPEDAGRLAQEMITCLSMDYKLSGGVSVHIGSSVGIVLFPDNAEDASTLMQYADAALYKSKAEGRGTYRYYTDELTQLSRKRLECETQLRHAIANNEFEVYYQPQVHITSGRIVGAEALIRWNHPTRGIVSPVEFIPIAEDTGLISEIGEWVLNDTCRQGKIWLDLGHRLTLAVNLSAHQVRYTDVLLIVEKALKKSGYDPKRLELELTESVLMQREEETIEMLHSLRAKGIRLAIDDFGTGYSSLSYLKRFPIDVLKIDKSFVDDIPYEADDMAIVIAIIAMGQALGFQVLAEGVEHIEQLEFLKEKGCTMYQGYFKSKPVPAREFELLLNS